MADEIEITKNALSVLSEASGFLDVTRVLTIATSFVSVFPLVGAVLALAQSFLPNAQHREILRGFENLSNKVDHVRNDIKELEKSIKNEFVKMQYGDVVRRIQLGMYFSLKATKSTGTGSKMRYQARLRGVCANQEFTLALNALLDGMTGDGDFHSSILDTFYEKTKGHRPMISSLAIRLLQLVCGGVMVHATCEAADHGKKGAEDMMDLYQTRLSEVKAKVQNVLEKCKTDFEENMLNDLNHHLDKGGRNEDLVSELHDFMRKKYDWLEHFCLIYNDIWGLDKHCFSGYLVDSLHRSGKCGIVFYRTAGKPARLSNKYKEARNIVKNVKCYNAEVGYDNIVDKLEERDISWRGCVVIKRYVDLWFEDGFSTKTVSIVGSDATRILMLD